MGGKERTPASDVGERTDQPDPSFSRILITGGAGFIASYVVRKLVKLYPEYTIINFDKLDYCSNIGNVAEVAHHPNYKFVQGDVTNKDFVSHVLREYRIDAIMHFAAQSHVDNSFKDSFEFTHNNIVGTHILLEAARDHGVSKFVYVSTDEVYGEVVGEEASREDSVLNPTNPYAATKAAAEQLVRAFYHSFKLPIVITRSNNVYGPFQYPEKIIPKFITSILDGKKCTVHGDGSHARYYLYATDVADAMTTILHRGIIGESYNIGSAFEVSNLALTRYLLLRMGAISAPFSDAAVDGAVLSDQLYHLTTEPLEQEEEYLEFVKDRSFNDRRYHIDSSKLETLGWRAKVDFVEVQWYRTNRNYWNQVGVQAVTALRDKAT